MLVGVPKGIETHEYCGGLTPGEVREYVAREHKVPMETGARNVERTRG